LGVILLCSCREVQNVRMIIEATYAICRDNLLNVAGLYVPYFNMRGFNGNDIWWNIGECVWGSCPKDKVIVSVAPTEFVNEKSEFCTKVNVQLENY
jgi:hypothetical protein